MGSPSSVPDIHTSPLASVLDHKLSSLQSINEPPMSVAAVGVNAGSLGRIHQCDVSGFVEFLRAVDANRPIDVLLCFRFIAKCATGEGKSVVTSRALGQATRLSHPAVQVLGPSPL